MANVKVILGKQPSTNSIATAETDPAGNFSFVVTDTGTYRVQIACPAREKCGLAAGTYGVRLAMRDRYRLQKRAASIPNLGNRPQKQLLVPDIEPARIQPEGLTIYTEDIAVTMVPAKIFGSLRPANPILSTHALTFIAEEGGPAPQPQKVTVIGAGETGFDYEIAPYYKAAKAGRDRVWMELSSTQGALDDSGVLPEYEVKVDHVGMTPGLYQAELRHCIYTRNGTKICSSLVASLVVKERGTSPALTAWRSGILFTSLVGANPEPVTTKVCNPSAEAVNWAATVPLAQAQLLTVTPRQGSLEPGACAEVTVTAVTRGLGAGLIQAPIAISRPGPAVPTPLVTLDTWVFVATPNCVANTVYPVVLAQPSEIVPRLGNNYEVIPVDNCGGRAAQGVVWATTGGGEGPVFARPASVVTAASSGPGTAQKAIAKGGSGGFFPLAPEGDGEDSTEVTFTGGGPIYAAQTTITKSRSNVKDNMRSVPHTPMGPVTSVANPGGTGAGAPGAAMARKCCYAVKQRIKVALVDSIEGASVLINGKKAPLLYSAPQEIDFVAPGDLSAGLHTLLLETPDALSMPMEFDVDVAQPGLYTQEGTGDGPAIVYNATRGITVSELAPARAGEVLVAYVDGLGAVDPAIPDGQAAPEDVVSRAVNPVEVTIAGKKAEVLFAGPVPGFAGFGQVNFQTPADFSSSEAVRQEEIVVTVAGIGNQQMATTWFAQKRTSTAKVTVTANPAGLAVFVDGVRTVTPRTFDWPVDSVHSLSVASPQAETATGRLQFLNWDGAVYAQSYTVTASSDFTVTANFLQQYKLTATANVPGTVPAGIRPTVTATPASADGFYITGTAVLLTAGNSAAVRFVNWTGDGTGTASTLLVTMSGAKTVTANYASSAPPATVTVALSTRTGGNIVPTFTNTSTVVATNLRITAIGPITADTPGTTIVWDQGVVGAPGLVLPWELGSLGAGVSTSRNLGFRATAGAISSGFRFAITIAADNMAAVTTTVVVPASGVAVLDVVSPVRTNSPGVIGVGFSVPNSGDVAAGNVQAAISVTVPNGSLQIGNPLVTLGSIDAGKTATLAVSLTGAPGANLAGVTFNIQVTLVYSQPSGATATVRHTWSMGTTVTQLN